VIRLVDRAVATEPTDADVRPTAHARDRSPGAARNNLAVWLPLLPLVRWPDML